MTLTPEFLDKQRERLSAELAEAQTSITQAGVDIEENRISARGGDAIIAKNMRRLTIIQNALERISNGTYGRCILCNKETHFSILTETPTTAFCFKCCEQLDRL